MILTLFSSCMPSRSQITPTLSPRPRPNSEYDIGIWHSEIEESTEINITSTLSNFDEHIDYEIEILPAKTLQDEVVLFYYLSWPDDTQF